MPVEVCTTQVDPYRRLILGARGVQCKPVVVGHGDDEAHGSRVYWGPNSLIIVWLIAGIAGSACLGNPVIARASGSGPQPSRDAVPFCPLLDVTRCFAESRFVSSFAARRAL
jgi:hypothetical protein